MKYDVATPYTAAHVMLRDGNKVAFVLRENTNWGDGFYGLLSGKVDHGESYLQAAVREVFEEGGVEIERADIKHMLTGHRNSDDSLWVDIIFEVTKWQGEAFNAEPDKHSELAWLDLGNLPQNVVPPIRYYLEQIAAGKRYAEYGWE